MELFNLYDIKALKELVAQAKTPTAIRHNSTTFIEALKKEFSKTKLPEVEGPAVVELYGIKVIADPTIPAGRLRIEYMQGGEKQFEEFAFT
jgi:hypothetical protein